MLLAMASGYGGRAFSFIPVISNRTFRMKRPIFLLFAFAALFFSTASAQTIIELKPGGRVRSKTADDYRRENGTADKAQADSLLYADNLRRAFTALGTDSLTEAERLFNECLKLRPDGAGNFVLRYNLALIRMARGQMSDAVSLLTQVVEERPDYDEARLKRAEANLQLGRATEALRDAESILSPANDYRTTPDDLPVKLKARFVKAAAHYAMRLYAEARTDLVSLLRLEPQNENALVMEALCLHHLGQPKEALNRLNFIVAAHPDNLDALSTRAQVECYLQLFTLAKGDYDLLVEKQPSQAEWLVERARTLISLDEKQAARRDLDKAVSMGMPMGMVQALYNLTRKK